MSLIALEKRLGDAASYIMKAGDRDTLIQWAIELGLRPMDVHNMSNVQLTNLYHERGTTELQRLAADMFVKMMGVFGEPIRPLPPMPDMKKAIAPQLKHYETDTIIQIISMSHPVMMVGPAGCGKTTIAEHAAQELELPFYITSTINEPHELTGFIDGYGKYHKTPFRQAFEFGGVWVADEIDAWDASALLAANAALANGYCNFPDVKNAVNKHENFRMVATANTFGAGSDRLYVGRNELDAATLDRFATIDIDYDVELERELAGGLTDWLEYVWNIRKLVREKKIRHVVSTRAIVMGTKALANGMQRSKVEEIYLYKGMSEKDRSKLE